MKKLMLSTILCLFFTASFAQIDVMKKGWDTQLPQGCFCCDESTYSLPQKPQISGLDTLCRCNAATYSTEKCKGASYSWSVVDNNGNSVAFTGQASASINITGPYANNANTILITVKITCGKKTVTNTKTVLLKPLPNISDNINVNQNPNTGVFTVTASGVAGYGNAWRFVEVVGPDDCVTWKSGNNLAQVASANFSWTGTLSPGKYYRLIHWVEKCSATWKAECYMTQVQCYAFSAASGINKNDKGTLKSTGKQLLDMATKEIALDAEKVKRAN